MINTEYNYKEPTHCYTCECELGKPFTYGLGDDEDKLTFCSVDCMWKQKHHQDAALDVFMNDWYAHKFRSIMAFSVILFQLICITTFIIMFSDIFSWGIHILWLLIVPTALIAIGANELFSINRENRKLSGENPYGNIDDDEQKFWYDSSCNDIKNTFDGIMEEREDD